MYSRKENTMNHFEKTLLGLRNAAFLFIMIAAPGYSQTIAGGAAKATTDATDRTNTAALREDRSIRPFRVHIPEAALSDLRERLAATRLSDRELDESQGVRLATMKELVRYWQTDYDWRKA